MSFKILKVTASCFIANNKTTNYMTEKARSLHLDNCSMGTRKAIQSRNIKNVTVSITSLT